MKTNLLLVVVAMALAEPAMAARLTTSLDGTWRFARDNTAQKTLDAAAADYDDSSWEQVRVPHDGAIKGPFDPSEGKGDTGMLPWRGVFWYRRTFTLPAERKDATVALEFDGAMASPEVYVNGHKAGDWDYGYMSFRVDATPFVNFGATNTVAVRCDTRNHKSRWYPGAGIYRDVRLVVQDPVRIAHESVVVTTPEVSRGRAIVQVEAIVTNAMAGSVHGSCNVRFRATLRGPDGKVAGRRWFGPDEGRFESEPVPVYGGTAHAFHHCFVVEDPALWDVDSPNLYTVEVAAATDDVNSFPRGKLHGLLDPAPAVLDAETVRFGIRDFEFTADDGLHLNGRRVPIQGVDLHSDFGPLGMAFNRSAARRQLEIMKEMGANALRTSHNPPAPQMLDLCDEMGILVWDECFDKWDGTSGRRQDQDLEDYVERNLRAFVRRDRNHPCVLVWSIGNEIPPADDKHPEGMTRARCAEFRASIRQFDTTRPVGIGNCYTNAIGRHILDDLDITGWNYREQYVPMKKAYPTKPVLYSESASALSSYGFYGLPPPANKTDYAADACEVSSYDHGAARWSDIADLEFARLDRDRYNAGEFVWTGIDYLGEPHPFWQAARSSYFGICDLTGMPKDRYYLYRSRWNRDSETIHILPHWNWAGHEGQHVPIFVYTSGDSAELFLNGKSRGLRIKGEKPKANAEFPFTTNIYYDVCTNYRLMWLDVPYEPGELKAVAYRNGKNIGEAVVRTAGKTVALKLTPEKNELPLDGDSVVFVKVEAVDKDGITDPWATNRIDFAVEGPGELVAVGNGNAHEMMSFAGTAYPLFYGRATAIVRRRAGTTGTVTLMARTAGLAPAKAVMR